MKSGIEAKMQLPFDYNLFILVVEHAYIVCPCTYIVIFWKMKGTSVYWPWSKGIHSNKTKSPNWLWLLTFKTKFLGFVGPLGTKTNDFWFARAIPWPTTRPSTHYSKAYWANTGTGIFEVQVAEFLQHWYWNIVPKIKDSYVCLFTANKAVCTNTYTTN